MKEQKYYTEEIKRFVDEISTDNVNGLRFLVIIHAFVKPIFHKVQKGGAR